MLVFMGNHSKSARIQVGLKHIAEEAGVSIATVSMALGGYPQVNEETRQRIQQISHRLAYRPHRRRGVRADADAKSVQPQRIGLILLGSPLQFEGNQYLLQALTLTTSRKSIRLDVRCVESVEEVDSSRPRLLEGLRELDGLVLCGHVHSPLLEDLANRRLPHVIFGPLPAAEYSLVSGYGQVVTPDALGMGLLAANTLIQEGHRRIGFMCRNVTPGLWNAQWLRGYRYALLDADIPQNPALIQILGQGESYADAFLAMDESPTAWIIPGPDEAVSFMNAMRKRGRDIPLQNVIAGGHTWAFHRPGADYCRLVGYDLLAAMELLVHQLGHIGHSPFPCTTCLSIPFRLIDSPE